MNYDLLIILYILGGKMSNNFNVNKELVLKTAKEILEFDSPTGFCFEIINKIEEMIKGYGYKFERTNKGCGIITI